VGEHHSIMPVRQRVGFCLADSKPKDGLTDRKACSHQLMGGKTTDRPLSGLKRSSATIASTSMTWRQPARTEVSPRPFENCWSCIDSNGARGTAMPHLERMPYPRKFCAFVC